MSVNNVIVVSDLHCGCRMGLCPPGKHHLDEGGTYEPSKLQLKMWEWWREFWDEWVPKVTRGEPYAIVLNGDMIDGEHHGSKTPISTNINDQRHIAQKALRPEIEKCENLYIVRGTEAHVGKSAEFEENFAESLGAVQTPTGEYSSWELWLRVGGKKGCLAHFMHHIGTTGRTHYESSAPMAELGEAFAEAGRWHDKAPDIVARAHRHRFIEVRLPAENGYGIVFVTPGWQLRTPFSQRIAGGRNSLPQFGGVLIRQGNEEHYTRSFVRNVSRVPEVVI